MMKMYMNHSSNVIKRLLQITDIGLLLCKTSLRAQNQTDMTKDDLIKQVVAGTGLPKDEVREVIEVTMERIKDSMKQGKNIYLRGFGSFVRVKRAPKIARDISRGTPIRIQERTVVKFRPAAVFSKMVKN